MLKTRDVSQLGGTLKYEYYPESGELLYFRYFFPIICFPRSMPENTYPGSIRNCYISDISDVILYFFLSCFDSSFDSTLAIDSEIVTNVSLIHPV